MKATYKIEFNDFGVCFVIASSIEEAVKKFRKSNHDGEDVIIKLIFKMIETNEPIN